MVFQSLDELLPLDAAKHGLGLWTGETDSAIDAQVTSYRQASLAWLEAVTGRHPVIARLQRRTVMIPCGDDPLRLWAPDGAFRTLAYWAPGQSAGAEPSGTVAAVGRSMEDGLGELSIWPVAEWPATMGQLRRGILTLDFEWDVNERDLGLLRSAALLYQRWMFTEQDKLATTARKVLGPLARPWLASAR